MNWIDVVIICILILSVYGGWSRGLIPVLTDLVSFCVSFWLALRFHAYAGSFLSEKFGIPIVWSNAFGYLIIAGIGQMVIGISIVILLRKIPEKTVSSGLVRGLAGMFSAMHAMLFVAFFLMLILSLPMRGTVKKDVYDSRIFRYIQTVVGRFSYEGTREALRAMLYVRAADC